MTGSDFEDILSSLSQGVREAGEPSAQPGQVAGVTSTAISSDGTVEVEVVDGLVTRLDVEMGAERDRRIWGRVSHTVNEALAANQLAVLEELKRVSPPYEKLAGLIDQTNADLGAAFQAMIGKERL